MNKMYLVMGLAILSLVACVSALTNEQKAEAAFFAKGRNWEFPTHESGWEALYAKSQMKGCTWVRERDGRSFIGQWVRTSYSEKTCLPLTKKKVVVKKKPIVIDIPLNVTSNSTIV